MAQDNGNGKGWLRERAETALRAALLRAYEQVRVDQDSYLMELRSCYGVPVNSYDGMFTLPVQALDAMAERELRTAMKLAAAEAAGFDLGGAVGLVPDMGVLAVLTMRTIQKLSLIYGFEYKTDEEVAELWIAAATAAGADITKDLIEKRILKVFVQKVSTRIAQRISAEFAEKFAARALPLVSSAVGAVMNWYFVRGWGRRAVGHFRLRHFAERERRAAMAAAAPAYQLPPVGAE